MALSRASFDASVVQPYAFTSAGRVNTTHVSITTCGAIKSLWPAAIALATASAASPTALAVSPRWEGWRGGWAGPMRPDAGDLGTSGANGDSVRAAAAQGRVAWTE
jgi:hypothetical protein